MRAFRYAVGKIKSLSETLLENLDSGAGYYFWGLSIMDGYHSAIIVVNNMDADNPSFNIFHQSGSMLSGGKDWYSGSDIDDQLIDYVKDGRTLPSGNRTKITTIITPIKHKENDENEKNND